MATSKGAWLRATHTIEDMIRQLDVLYRQLDPEWLLPGSDAIRNSVLLRAHTAEQALARAQVALASLGMALDDDPRWREALQQMRITANSYSGNGGKRTVSSARIVRWIR